MLIDAVVFAMFGAIRLTLVWGIPFFGNTTGGAGRTDKWAFAPSFMDHREFREYVTISFIGPPLTPYTR
jgi:hypothetical protein